MIKYFCDSCSKEITRYKAKSVSVPCHLWSLSSQGLGGYQDQDGNNVSGRMDEIILCQKCYNDAFGALIKAIKESK